MISKELVIEELISQGIAYEALSLQLQKALIVSIRMKAIYDPLPVAVQKSYAELVKNNTADLYSTEK